MGDGQCSEVLMGEFLHVVDFVRVRLFPVLHEETRNVLVVGSLGDQRLQVGILEPAAFLDRHFRSDEPDVPVVLASDQSDLKLHSIGSQRAGLIGKDILDLPQFLIKRGGPHRRALLPQLAEHELVVVYEVGLRHLDNLDGDDERDGDHGVEEDQVGAEDEEPIADGGVVFPGYVGMGSGFGCDEVAVEYSEDHAEDDLEEQDEAEDEVDFPLDLRHLVGLALRVHHDLAVTPRVDSQPVDPLGVLEASLAVKQLFVLTEVYPALGLHLQGRLELMQLLIRRNALQRPSELQQLLLTVEALGLRIRVPGFEVLFSVETGGFNKGVTGGKRRTDKDKICREALFLLNEANIANKHLAPFYFGQHSAAQDIGLLLVVQGLVGFVALVVLVA